MPSIPLSLIVDQLETLLGTQNFPDYPGAHNGLQLQNRSLNVTRIATAVDACEAVITEAISAKADLLIAHHGLFWNGIPPLTGAAFRKINACMEANLAVYSCHLPLDAHPDLGNNALILKTLNLPEGQPCLPYKGSPIGRITDINLTREELLNRVETHIGPAKIAPGGPIHVKKLIVSSGGSGSQIIEAAALGADTFLVGEGPHWTYSTAEETGINLIYAGHYATEVFGVKALGSFLENAFSLPWSFHDHPSGL